MEYESEPLPFYSDLSNCSYSVIFLTPLPCLFLWFVYRVLILPAYHLAVPRHMLRLRAQYIDRASDHPLRYVHLLPYDFHSNGVDSHCVHRLIYRFVLPLSTYPAFLDHSGDPSRHLIMEFRQDLEHLPGHHPALAAI